MSFALEVSPQESLRARYLHDVLRMLRSAVDYRVDQGATKKDIAAAIGKSPSVLSRIVNGHVRNITIETIADILYATGHDPVEPKADPVETLQHNAGEWTVPCYQLNVSTITDLASSNGLTAAKHVIVDPGSKTVKARTWVPVFSRLVAEDA